MAKDADGGRSDGRRSRPWHPGVMASSEMLGLTWINRILIWLIHLINRFYDGFIWITSWSKYYILIDMVNPFIIGFMKD